MRTQNPFPQKLVDVLETFVDRPVAEITDAFTNAAQNDHSMAEVYKGLSDLSTQAKAENSAAAYAQLGGIFSAAGCSGVAIPMLEQACKEDPLDIISINTLGYNYEKVDRLNEALACYEKVLELDRELSFLFPQLTMIVNGQEKPFDYAPVIQDSRESASNIALRIGLALRARGSLDEANPFIMRGYELMNL
jgi:tetratricopeptide (TPR) repeat protein